ncbi:hypothetical protein [Qipengyuania sp. NPDC077563]|uniref:hypothetical protein n=1 Tax=Qipengyuania sp. NPDC077563 TaxID=3364497 RepID=UPI00384AC1DE
MKTKLIGILTAAASLSLVAACSGADEPAETDTAADREATENAAETAAAEPAADAEQPAIPEGPLADGTWKVVETRLTRPNGVSAIGDAELAAARNLSLSVTPSSINWQGDAISGPLKGYGFDANCASPIRNPEARGGFSLRCDDGETFGPAVSGTPAFAQNSDGTVTVNWFDGMTLVLRKDG